MENKIYLSILWHQHQPFYKDLKSGRSVLPWVRLHATKDYYDMVAILDEFPKIRLNINLVPSLLVQLQDYATGKATDPWLDKSLTPAKDLSPKDQVWILENFFFCNWETKIYPFPRFNELFEKRGKYISPHNLERIRTYFSVQEFLDLQVWFNLAWMDPLWQEKDPLIAHLFKKGRDFSEGEKIMLLEKQKEICQLTIDKHRELWEKGQIEISTTPFYHPILPLLYDTDSCSMSMPHHPKPKKRFQHPEDAKHQIDQALQYMEDLFGKRPVGMWPSEGSVSEEMVSVFKESGIQWIATDEGILFNSLKMMGSDRFPRESLFQPYSLEMGNSTKENPLQIVFRDHGLSDAIGFVYARADHHKSVEDFVQRIHKIGASANLNRPTLINVILDGENCWEYYSKDGLDFIRTLYKTISEDHSIEMTTIQSYLERFPATKSLNKLWAGSWINSDFSIWIGHPQDNRAWDLLSEAREFLLRMTNNHPELAHTPELHLAWESLYIAEGSDWCWWYGDQNSTAHDELFDELFRTHLKNIYTFLKEEPPEKLNIAIKGKEEKGRYFPPIDFITPKIDGMVTNYYEWRAAGTYQMSATGGAMHQAESFLTTLYYGFDLQNLYIRLDTKTPLISSELDLSDYKIKISFLEPRESDLQIEWNANKNSESQLNTYTLRAIYLDSSGETNILPQANFKKIIELALPFSLLGVEVNEKIEFAVTVLKSGMQIERIPSNTTIKLARPSEQFNLDYWSV